MNTSHIKPIDWSAQHCGVHAAPFVALQELMPDLKELLGTFPDDPEQFSWDVKVHMLMPGHHPCIPNWHYDNVPREGGVQRMNLAQPELPMYLWVSGPPLTQFLHGYVRANHWHRFSQLDIHRGCPAADFGWRGFIRATHKDIKEPRVLPVGATHQRRHAQVYLDAETTQW